MVRHNNKIQWFELLDTLEEAHNAILNYYDNNNMESFVMLLEDCSDAAIGLINSVRGVTGDAEEIFSDLEKYRNTIYNLRDSAQKDSINNMNAIRKNLKKNILEIRSAINALEDCIEIVFLPYKASMWDSFESIWQAADEDEACDVYVIPIPYYDRNPDGSFGELHYEGDLFPEYVPITHFDDYNLEYHHPDAIIIHNPYDGINLVTSVHPYFYSANLKQFTDCLVYSPYFVAPGKLGEGNKYLPSYDNMDIIVVQSESIREQYDKRISQEKFLVSGSPKFDRIISMCKTPPNPPVEWKNKMEGKRVFFYNTSISDFLRFGEKYIKKMEYVFDLFSVEKSACIIWRPHPLLEATMDSMIPECKIEYLRLKEMFIEKDIGILDTTDDIDKTISLSDAYLGDGASSVVSLFEVANKPIYFIDYELEQKKNEYYRRRLFQYTIQRNNMDRFCLVASRYAMVSLNNDYHYKFAFDLDEKGEGLRYLGGMAIRNKGYFFPMTAKDIVEISLTGETKRYSVKGIIKEGTVLSGFGIYKNKAVLYGVNEAIIIVFDLISKRINYTYLPEGYYYSKDSNGQLKCSAVSIGWKDKVIVTNNIGTECILIDIHTFDKEKKYLPVGKRIQEVFRECRDADKLWLRPFEGTTFYEWNTIDDSFTEHFINMEGLKSFSRVDNCPVNENYFSNAVIDGNHIFFSPWWSNMFIKYDLTTHKSTKLELPFRLFDGGEMSDEFLYGGGYFGIVYEKEFDPDDYNAYQKKGDQMFFCSNVDCKVYNVDLKNLSMTPFDIDLDLETLYEKGKMGFHVDSETGMYYCGESALCSVQDIIKDNIGEHIFDSDIQRKNLKTLNVSPKGDAGSKIFRYIKDKVR